MSPPASNGRLRVLVLSRNYPNEVQGHLGLWAERLVRQTALACDPTVIAPVPYCPPLPQWIEYARFRRIARFERRRGLVIHHPRFVVGLGSTLFAFEADAYTMAISRTVNGLFAEGPFDLIHAHFTYPDGVAAARLGIRYGVPVVITEHALWADWLDRYPRVRRQAVWAAQHCALHLAVSEAGRASIARHIGEVDRLRVLPIGIDTSIFRLTDGQTRQPNQILYVGFLNATKGVDVLLRAMKRVLEGRPQARLVLAGGAFYRDTRRQAERLTQLATDLGLADAVSFRGLQPPETIAALMRESAVLVLPSRRESFGSVLGEALACGTPVVATRCGGPEDIVNERVGLLVPVDEPEGLAEGIERVLANPGQYNAAELFRYASARFGWDRVGTELVALYREAIRRAGHAGTGQDRST